MIEEVGRQSEAKEVRLRTKRKIRSSKLDEVGDASEVDGSLARTPRCFFLVASLTAFVLGPSFDGNYAVNRSNRLGIWDDVWLLNREQLKSRKLW